MDEKKRIIIVVEEIQNGPAVSQPLKTQHATKCEIGGSLWTEKMGNKDRGEAMLG